MIYAQMYQRAVPGPWNDYARDKPIEACGSDGAFPLDGRWARWRQLEAAKAYEPQPAQRLRRPSFHRSPAARTDGAHMTPTEFDAAYDPERKCYATYRDACGDRLSGLIIDGRHRGVTNVDFAYIDNFTQGIPLARIEKIYRTKEAWI